MLSPLYCKPRASFSQRKAKLQFFFAHPRNDFFNAPPVVQNGYQRQPNCDERQRKRPFRLLRERGSVTGSSSKRQSRSGRIIRSGKFPAISAFATAAHENS